MKSVETVKYKYINPKKLGFKKAKLTQKEFSKFSTDEPDLLQKIEIWIKDDEIQVFYLLSILGKLVNTIKILLSQFKIRRKWGRRSLIGVYDILRQRSTGNFLCYPIIPEMEMFSSIHSIITECITPKDSKKSKNLED